MAQKIKIGDICINKTGVVGIVFEKRRFWSGKVDKYTGKTFDGKRWESKNPQFVSDNLSSYIQSHIYKAARMFNFPKKV